MQTHKVKSQSEIMSFNSGVSDDTYDVISALYHTLQDCETLQRYVSDAKRAKDKELVDLFNEFQEEDRERAAKLQKILSKKICFEASSQTL